MHVCVCVCAGQESLRAGYTQEPKLALVVRGVYAFAHALHDMRRQLCASPPTHATHATHAPHATQVQQD